MHDEQEWQQLHDALNDLCHMVERKYLAVTTLQCNYEKACRERDDTWAEVERWQKRYERKFAERYSYDVTRLREALQQYGGHHDWCGASPPNCMGCTCGFAEVLAGPQDG